MLVKPQTNQEWAQAFTEARAGLTEISFADARLERARVGVRNRCTGAAAYLEAHPDETYDQRQLEALERNLAPAWALLDPVARAETEAFLHSASYRDHCRLVRQGTGLVLDPAPPVIVPVAVVDVLGVPRGWYAGHLLCISELRPDIDPALLHELVHSGQPHIRELLNDPDLSEDEKTAVLVLVEGATQHLADLVYDPDDELPSAAYPAEVETHHLLASRLAVSGRELALLVSLSATPLTTVGALNGLDSLETAALIKETFGKGQHLAAVIPAYEPAGRFTGVRERTRVKRSYADFKRLRESTLAVDRLESGPETRPALDSLDSLATAATDERAPSVEPSLER